MTRSLFSVVCLLAGTAMASAAALPVADHARTDGADHKAVMLSTVPAPTDGATLKPLVQPVEAATSAREYALVLPGTFGPVAKK